MSFDHQVERHIDYALDRIEFPDLGEQLVETREAAHPERPLGNDPKTRLNLVEPAGISRCVARSD